MSRRRRRHVRMKEKRPPERDAKLKSKSIAIKNSVQSKKKKHLLHARQNAKKIIKKTQKAKLNVKKSKMKLSEDTPKPPAKSPSLSSNDQEKRNFASTNFESKTDVSNINKEKEHNKKGNPDSEITEELKATTRHGATSSVAKSTLSEDTNSAVLEDVQSSDEKADSIEAKPDESASYISTNCNKESDLTSPLTLHIKPTNSSNQIHKCALCFKVLSSASSLDRHMLVHSGERPFKCKVCDMAFTTNGNMHRHMRTHSEFLDISDASKTGDLRRRDSYKRKASFSSDSSESKKLAQALDEEQENLHCPVCGKSFLCKYGLQCHMETHPNDPILCQSCGDISANYTEFVNHKCDMSGSKSNSSVTYGFQDLTFLDFSAKKFSLVSKSLCEQNIKRPSSAFHVFECSECKKSFPCGRALKLHKNVHNNKIGTFCPSCHCNFETPAFFQLHQLKHRSAEHCLISENIECNSDDGTGDVEVVPNGLKIQSGKEDFLAVLDLQTKQSQMSFLRSFKSCKVKEENFENMDYFVHGKIKDNAVKRPDSEQNANDFADIQSIISLTSKAPLIGAVQSSPVSVRPSSPLPVVSPQHPESPQTADSASESPETPSKNAAVRLTNKDTSIEIFSEDDNNNTYSCKICSQKFKSVNTLKRHSKLHIQRGSNYSCHLCSYVSVDKSTLVRHLRTHNGERPFQCVICKYAFTTKANCERHVRKRHKKLTKSEIRNFMQYNPNMALKSADASSSDISNSETVCKYCNVDFKFNRVLRHHLRSLHNSCNRKPFNCKICKFGFSTKNNCIRHVLKQHPNLKDKLRSVVIPNSTRDLKDYQSSESDNTTENITSDASVSFTTASEQSEPVNLNCAAKEQPLDLQVEKVASNASTTNEAVIAAESLVSLSEAIPHQKEPLDLAVRPLDLRCRSIATVTEKYNSKPASIYSLPLYSISPKECNFLDLSTSKMIVAPEKKVLSSSPENPNILSNPIPKTAFKKVLGSEMSMHKHRAFICTYCSAGFTLKSNMERHIKRKHPEFARPTRSRNYIPAVIAQNPPKHNTNMLSDKTRDALRNVLSTKVQQALSFKGHFNSSNVYACKPALFNFANNVLSKAHGNNAASSNDNNSLDLSNKSFRNPSSGNLKILIPKPYSNTNEDENSADLASVSAVICTANSQLFKHYFEKPIQANNNSAHLENSCDKSKDAASKEVPSSSVSCPFCARKFPWSSSLRRHILTHTGQKPYKCPRCVLWFTTKSNCERHLIRKHGHKGDLITRSVPDRPYKCNQCPTSTFSTQGNLRKHFYLKHWTRSCLGMNSKVVDDENCDKHDACSSNNTTVEITSDISAARSVSTQEHSYSQSGKKDLYSCHFCNEQFADIQSLARHMPKHDNVIYMCYLCRKTFPKSDACYNHFKTSHSLVYMQIVHSEANDNEPIAASNYDADNEDDRNSESEANNVSSMACMVCFQRISSVDALQQHIKKHLQKEKVQWDIQESSTENSAVSYPAVSQLLPRSSVHISGNKKSYSRKKVKNSLLYLFASPRKNVASASVLKNTDINSETTVQEEGTDLIQNLLGIHDSKIIDEMLVSADSAARLLGVKEI